jgi:hypothetical protein
MEADMKSLRNIWSGALACLLLVGGTSRARADEAAADTADTAGVTPVAPGASASFEGTISSHSVDHPYFGRPGADRRAGWAEGFERLRVNYGRSDGAWCSVGGVLMLTAGKDYYGTENAGDGRLDQLVVGAANVLGSGVSVTAGRQDLVLGDGFLIGDGYRDSRAALWNIPLNFYDALRVDWKRNGWHVLGFDANLSPSLYGMPGDYPRGRILGGEAGWSPEGNSDVTGTYLERSDNGPDDLDARAYGVRLRYGRGAATFAGELVLEGGTRWGFALAGHGGHARLDFAPAAKHKPTIGAEYFVFSGDKPGTIENEAYDPWQFRWSDWSQYYGGDFVSSTVGSSSDMRIALLRAGWTVREGTGLRLLAHRMDADTGASLGLAPGASRAFAYEYDLVVDQAFGPHWSAWVMGGYATPLDAAKAEYGGANSGQVFASVSWKFSGPGGAGE